jgi:hypothetical protein
MRVWPGFLLVMIAGVLMTPSLLDGKILGDSSYLNVVWSQGFAERLFAGDLYPRWLPQMSLGAGSPVFYFYAPLPFFLIAPFHLVAEAQLALALGSWMILALSGLAFRAMAEVFVRPGPALFAALIYMAMPYHFFVDVLWRASIGEQTAYIFMPLSLLCAHHLDKGGKWSLGLAASFAGLLLSHLPSSLLFSPFLAGFCLYTAWQRGTARVLVRASFAVALSGGLAAAYVMPALSLQGMIHSEIWSAFRPSDNFLFANHTNAFVTKMELITLILVPLYLYCSVKILKNHSQKIGVWISFMVATIFVMTPTSAWLWEMSPLFERIQFPWRALVIFELAGCMIFAMALNTRDRGSSMLVFWFAGAGITMAMWFGMISGTLPLGSRTEAEMDALVAARADAAEYLPACRHLTGADEFNGLSSIRIVEKDLRNIGRGQLPVFYFPFLEVTVDGLRQEISCDLKSGFITADLTAGSAVEITKSVQPVERIGNLISLASALFLALGLIWCRARSDGAIGAMGGRVS